MKKITLLFLLFAVSFLAKAQTFNFNTDSDLEGWTTGGADPSVAGGIMTLAPKSNINPNIQFKNGIDANANGYVHIAIKNYSNIANEIRFRIRNLADTGDTFINTAISMADSDFKTYNLELAGKDGWSGMVNLITIRFTDRKTLLNGPADNIDVDFVIFDNNPTLKVESLEKFKFSFYPNPTKEEVNLSATQPVEQIQVYTLLGQEVLNMKFDNQLKQVVNISSLSSGVYNMKVTIGNTVGVVKFIKNN